MNQKSIFVTGTDTGVGKTITSAYLLKYYINYIPNLRYWKPVQTGFPPDDDGEVIKNITGLDSKYILHGLKFKEPVSPHYAAERENQIISIEHIKQNYYEYIKDYTLIIEGAGGILVPLTRKYLWIDFVSELRLPVLIVARSTLGTINHTLLTIEVLKQKNISIIGIIFCGKHDEPYIEDNRKIISELSSIPIISYYDINIDRNINIDPHKIILKYLKFLSV